MLRIMFMAALVGFATSAVASTGHGQIPPRDPAAVLDTLRLSLGEAVARAVTQSEEVRLARAQVDLADAQVTGARSAAFPQIDGTFAYTRTFESAFQTGGITIPDSLLFEPDTTASVEERIRYLERRVPTAALGGIGSLFGDLPFGRENAYNASVSLSQPLYTGGRLGAALGIAREFRAAARFTLDEELAEIELQIRNAYVRAQLARELEAIAQAAVVQAQEFLAQEQLRLEAGTASELEVLRADVALENLRPQLVESRNAAELAMLDLKRLADLPLRQPLALTTELAVPSAEQLAQPTVEPEFLVAQRAAVQAAERQVAIREGQVRIARGEFLPQVGLQMAYGRQLFPTSVFDFSGQDWRTDWTATVAVQVPIFTGFRRGAELEQAQIELRRSELQLAQLREAVQLQYEQARGEKQRAAATIAARQRTVEQAQRVYDLTVLRYEQGLATQLEVTDARLALLQSRTNLAQALADFYSADASILRAQGLGSDVARQAGTAGPEVPVIPPPATTAPPQ